MIVNGEKTNQQDGLLVGSSCRIEILQDLEISETTEISNQQDVGWDGFEEICNSDLNFV